MAILGLGADLVDPRRVERLIARREDIFRERILGAGERLEISSHGRKQWRVLAYASSIAAKEAFLKALGTGLTGGMRWPEIEMLDRAAAQPRLQVSGAVARVLARLESDAVHVSLSAVSRHVLAVVTLTRQEAPGISL